MVRVFCFSMEFYYNCRNTERVLTTKWFASICLKGIFFFNFECKNNGQGVVQLIVNVQFMSVDKHNAIEFV